MNENEFAIPSVVKRSEDQRSYRRTRIQTGVSIEDMLNSLVCCLGYNGVLTALADYEREWHVGDDAETDGSLMLDRFAEEMRVWEESH